MVAVETAYYDYCKVLKFVIYFLLTEILEIDTMLAVLSSGRGLGQRLKGLRFRIGECKISGDRISGPEPEEVRACACAEKKRNRD